VDVEGVGDAAVLVGADEVDVEDVEDVAGEGALGKICPCKVELGELALALAPVRVLAGLGGGKVYA